MRYGLDTAFAPSAAAAHTMFQRGWTIFGGYIGGVRAAHAWQNSDFGRLAEVGFTFVLYYVGRTAPFDNIHSLTWDQGFNEGLDADDQCGRCGFDVKNVIWLDAEAGDFEADNRAYTDYCDGWCEAVHDADHPTGLYSDPLTIELIGSHFDYTQVASYWTRGTQIQRPSDIPSWVDPSLPPPSNGWQFADLASIAGVGVDLNVWDDTTPMAVYSPPQ